MVQGKIKKITVCKKVRPLGQAVSISRFSHSRVTADRQFVTWSARVLGMWAHTKNQRHSPIILGTCTRGVESVKS